MLFLQFVKRLSSKIQSASTLHTTSNSMAKSRFEYVRQFETTDSCLPNCWIVVRIDGKNFHKFSDKHCFAKPNDDRSLKLMTKSAKTVMEDFSDVILAYGQSDEFSFVFKKETKTYNRRACKLMTNVVSLFASSFVFNWAEMFPSQPLLYPPAFDARVVLYPSDQNLQDYFSWRQADCHINNLYNTCFWALIQQGGLSAQESQQKLKGTLSGDKNELLFSQFNTNYNDLPLLYRKGTTLFKEKAAEVKPETAASTSDTDKGKPQTILKQQITIFNGDIIGKEFWHNHPYLLGKNR